MELYKDFDSFVAALNSSPVRRVTKDGSIMMQGRRYIHDDLVPMAGQCVRAFVDLDGASAVCFTPFDKRFVCNAQNPELWAVMTADLNA